MQASSKSNFTRNSYILLKTKKKSQNKQQQKKKVCKRKNSRLCLKVLQPAKSRMQPELLQGTEHPAVEAGEGQDKLGTRNSCEGLGSARESCSLG